ncbi:MAG: hypothetical protein CMF64_04360, partial [Magnetovibrio sp.]|nr:hypothetical protein [Magnetovibrio sp.]
MIRRNYDRERLDRLRAADGAVSEAARLGLLSVRAANCLKNDGIETLAEMVVADPSPADLLRVPNFGPTSLLDIGLLLTALQLVVPSFDFRDDNLLKSTRMGGHWAERFELTGTERPEPGAESEPDEPEAATLMVMARDLRALRETVQKMQERSDRHIAQPSRGQMQAFLRASEDDFDPLRVAAENSAIWAAAEISAIFSNLTPADVLTTLVAAVIDAVRRLVNEGRVEPKQLEVFHSLMVKALVGMTAGDARTSVTAQYVEATGADLGLTRKTPLAALPPVGRGDPASPAPSSAPVTEPAPPAPDRMPANLVHALVAWRELETFFDRTPELRVQGEVDARLAELRETVDLHLPQLRTHYNVASTIDKDRLRAAERLLDEGGRDDRPGRP